MCPRPKKHKEKESLNWLDRPENVRKVTRGFYGLCIGIILVDLVFSLGWHKHAALSEDSSLHTFETLPAFYGIVGLVGCAALVMTAKFMRGWKGKNLLMREEDYWEK